ncbi:MAG: exo-alpha-sialidase [Acidobacteriota bacterium]
MRKRIALASIAIVLPAIAADESKPLLWGGSPYTLEWLQENHGKYDNRWTAVYEQWLQGDWILEVGPDGTERLRAADVRMSNPSFNTSQNEFQIVINPTDPTNAVGTSNDSLASGVGVYTTTDSGATWTAFDAPFGIGACCDPGVAFAANGDVYVTTLAAPPVYIIRSTDKGATWGPRHTVPGISDRENVTVDNGATSPFNGRVYVTYSFGGNGSQIAGYSSTDQGTTWQATGVIGGPSPPAGYQQSSDPYVASDGTLYVGYQEYENQSAGCVAPVRNWLSKSTDGGATFTQSLITGAPIVQGGICLASQAGRGVFCINGGGQYFRSRSHHDPERKPD